MKRLCMTMLALCAAVSAAYGGTTYYFKVGATDFTEPSNYATDSAGTQTATSIPGAEDQIILPDNATFAIAGGDANFNVLSGVRRIRPRANSVLEFTIADGATSTLNAAVNWDADSKMWNVENGTDAIHHWGKIVKKGGGTLILAASGTMKYGITVNQDYFTAIDLQQGTLKLPQHAVGNMYFGDLTMAEGTTLVTCGDVSDSSLARATLLRSLNGYGIVTNETGRSSGQICTTYERNVVACSEFHGKFCHPVRHWLNGRFVQYGHETGITQPVTVQYNLGHLNDGYDRGVYSFEDVALLGSNANIQFYSTGGGIHYFGGVDAEMAKNVNLYSYAYPGFFDAGWHGGIRCTGSWNVSADTANSIVQKWLVLTGSNTVPCTIEGAFAEKNSVTNQYGVPYTIVVQKLGSGTWRFKNDRSHAGGFAIEEGTLQFDSIAEKGVKSALGLSTNLTEICSVANPTSVDYAFSLGSTSENAPDAAFEFAGAKSCQSGTRPLALKGKGGSIRASGTDGARLGFGGISALAAGETTLVLDGTNTQSNVATGITDGNGVVSVVKDGSGDWYLSGTNTFSGDLLVKSGTLTVQGSKYSWFRFTIKEMGSNTRYMQFRQLALYDPNGVRQNIGLHVNPPASTPYSSTSNVSYSPDSDWMALEPGSFAFGSNDFLCKYTETTYVDQILSDSYISAGGFKTQIFTTDNKARNLSKDDPSTWVPFVMRLTNGAPEIVRYDIQSLSNSGNTNTWPKVASMEASVDGIHWELVETNVTGEVLTDHAYDFSIAYGGSSNNANRWYSDGTEFVSGQARPGAGFPIRGHADIPTPLQNVRSVSVAAGATLKTDAGVEIRSLKVDSAGAGTIDGFSFAENGTLDVTIAGAVPQDTLLPGTYVNYRGLENVARWDLKINGSQAGTKKYVVSVRDGAIHLLRRGFIVYFR